MIMPPKVAIAGNNHFSVVVADTGYIYFDISAIGLRVE